MRQFSESAPRQSATSFRSSQFSRVAQHRIAGCSAILCLYPPHYDTAVRWMMKHPAGAPASYEHFRFHRKTFWIHRQSKLDGQCQAGEGE